MDGSTVFMDWKMQYCEDINCLQWTYKFNAISITITEGYLVGFGKLILKHIQKYKDLRTAKIMLQKNKIKGLSQPDI